MIDGFCETEHAPLMLTLASVGGSVYLDESVALGTLSSSAGSELDTSSSGVARGALVSFHSSAETLVASNMPLCSATGTGGTSPSPLRPLSGGSEKEDNSLVPRGEERDTLLATLRDKYANLDVLQDAPSSVVRHFLSSQDDKHEGLNAYEQVLLRASLAQRNFKHRAL
jgi:hypothetical protein